jgi:hypothetical protein
MRAKLIFWILCLPALAMASDLERTLPEHHRQSSLIADIRIRETLNFCGEPVPLEIGEVRERLEKELLLTLNNGPQIILWLKRAARYLPHIEAQLAQRGLPDDLKFVPFIESALLPHIGSPAGAIGYWQFMRSTGRRYGLTINSEYDERRSIFKSTPAALAYFQELYEEFRSWTLAAAAYNMGEEGLRAEILIQEVNDYYLLYLPLETQRYVFRIIAAKLVLQNPERYGFRLESHDLYEPHAFDMVQVVCLQRTPIRLIATATGSTFKQIKDLNPDVRGHHLAPGTHELLVPKGAAEGFEARFNQALKNWQENPDKHHYTVRAGDNLSAIAERFEVPLPALLIWNNLSSRQTIHPGDRLIIYKQVAETGEIDSDSGSAE